jgi:hypothetical protein
VVETKSSEKNTDGADFEDEEEEEEEMPAHVAANPKAVEAWLARIREKALAKEARRRAHFDKIEKKRLSKITSISGAGSRQAASPKMGAPSHSSKNKKRK